MPESTRSSKGADDGVWILVLAGGVGSRFWPASTPERPKQLLPLAGPDPLVAETLERARSLVPDERIRVLASSGLVEPFRRELAGLDAGAYLEEPQARGTCPALARAAWEITRKDPDAVLVSLHSDHLIRPLDAFQETIRAAVEVARTHGALVTIGVVPNRIETGFGHVQPGAALETPGVEAHRVDAFHEKPDRETAREYMDAGYLWNSGIFVWKASVFLDEVRRLAPEVGEHLDLLEEGAERFFAEAPTCVVDTAVLERSDRVALVRATFEWDDVGSWEALARTRDPDAAGNVTAGDVRVMDGSGNVVFAEGGEVVLWGVHDLVVVRTPGATLVMPRERAAALKDLVAELEKP